MNKILTALRSSALPSAALCCAAALVSACASPHGGGDAKLSTHDVPVNIKFDGAGCPIDVKPKVLPIGKGKFILWRSVEDPNDPNPIPKDADYRVYFDPFAGKLYKSHWKGWLRSQPFSRDVPPEVGAAEVEYKYTIVGEKCKDKPLDPRIRLRR